MFQISGIIVDKSGRDYSGNMENAHDLKTERFFCSRLQKEIKVRGDEGFADAIRLNAQFF